MAVGSMPRPDLAEQLRPWLADKPLGGRVFNLPDKTANMIRKDLAAARAAWIEAASTKVERELRQKSDLLEYDDHAGRVADSHALRHTFISRVVESGASVKVAQELARHSTAKLTIDRYAHTRMHDLSKALDNLPATEPTGDEREAAVALATGTYDGHAGTSRLTPPQNPQQSQRETVRRGSIRCDKAATAGASGEQQESLENKGKGDAVQRRATPDKTTPPRTRTWDPLIKNQLLCQLS